MVGAGFSRNSADLFPGNGSPPTLDDLEGAIFKELYPQSGLNDRGDTTNQLNRSNSFPQLAQEYVAAYGHTQLHQFLKDHICDNQLIPTNLHERLLSLPWRDVFTTNWDTLLEKSLISVPEHKYSILRNKDEIPLSAQPRIVKLHGSFPSHFPLICTQEDYRTYPVKFAPFVNTVQQSMMESVFLLIGFSGDDPNFMHWTGWVRDNLGESAPKIYLAGWLDLSLSQRRVLEHRNVVAIDLAHHPKANGWPEHQRHKSATQWILHTLEQGRPYTITEWPSPEIKFYPPIPDELRPVVESCVTEPKEEPHPSNQAVPEKFSTRVDWIIDTWAHNRSLYPGWLATPVSITKNMSNGTDDWEPIVLNALPNLDPIIQLRIIYELIWRREVFLDPLSNELETAARGVLRVINCDARTVNCESKSEIDWSYVRRDYRNVLLALVTTARLRFDHETFKKRLKALEGFKNDDPDVSHRIHHERCLWAIFSLDYRSLSDLLGSWKLENCDPFWMVRKAALLYEINKLEEAKELARRALEAIRKIPDDSSSVAGFSREGWSMELSVVIESTESRMKFIHSDQGKFEYPPNLSRFKKRWRELAAMKCNAPSELREYANALANKEKREPSLAFDLGMKTGSTIVFSNAEHHRWKAAHRVIRLFEVVGLPMFGFYILKAAAEELSVSEPEMGVRIILRTLVSDGDESLKRLLSRPRVAMISAELARKLANICDSVIKYALPRVGVVDIGYWIQFWTERMQVAMEALSRLVVRLDAEDVENVFKFALAAYQNEAIIQKNWSHRSLRNLLRRSWHALPTKRQDRCILDLLSAPILGKGNTVRERFLYPSPNELFHNKYVPPDRTVENEDRWQQIITQLVRGLNDGGDVRMRASLWIRQIVLWKRLTEKENSLVAQALWSNEFIDSTGLPTGTDLYDWEFMILPEPEADIAKQHFHDKYFSDKESVKEDEKELRGTLSNIGSAISGLKIHGKSFAFSGVEKEYLIDLLRKWSDVPMPDPKNANHSISLHSVDRLIMNEIVGVSTIISELTIPTDIAEKLYQKMNGLSDLDFATFGFIPGLSVVLADRFDELVQNLRLGLVSQNEYLAEEALRVLETWLPLTIEPVPHIQPPPDDIVREVGVMIAARRKEILGYALQGAKWIFDKGADTHKEAINGMTLVGLTYLLEELQYDRNDIENNYDVPHLRYQCAQLVSSMCANGLQNEPTIVRWLQDAKEDPLPEVRYAVDTV